MNFREVLIEGSTFSILKQLGSGTYGKVYLVRNQQNEISAMKWIKNQCRVEGIPAFALREISLLKELKHPNIIKLQAVEYDYQGNIMTYYIAVMVYLKSNCKIKICIYYLIIWK